jgi:PhnB protein
MSEKVSPIPQGFTTLTPHLVVRDAAKAIEFYKSAFGAEEIARMPGPDGKLMHAELKIGDSIVMLADEFPEWGSNGPLTLGGTPVTLHLYVEDADAAFNRAVEAGATVKMALNDAFWGDRYGQLADPFGHTWSIATHVKDLTPEEMNAAAAAAMSGGRCE